MRFATTTVFLAILTTVCLQAAAQESEGSWQPPPPMPDDFDWVQMKNGEWLKGEIIAMYDDVLEFDSDEFDVQKLDIDDIQIIRSAQLIQVALVDGGIHTGKLLVDGETVRVLGEGGLETSRGQVLSLTAGAPRERNFWSGKLGAGLNVRTGNTEQTDFNANLNLIRRTPINRVNFDYLGNFSENDGATTADNQRANIGWNRFLTRRFYLTPAYGEYFRDPFQNIAQRYTIGAGAGYQIVDSSKIEWSVDAGLAYQRTNFDSVQEGDAESVNTPALTFGTFYGNEITKWMDFLFEYKIQVVNEESGSFNHHLNTGFEFEFFSDFDFNVSLVWDRTQKPQQNADGTFPEQNDFRTIFGLGYSF